jgi:hypothetical protein
MDPEYTIDEYPSKVCIVASSSDGNDLDAICDLRNLSLQNLGRYSPGTCEKLRYSNPTSEAYMSLRSRS